MLKSLFLIISIFSVILIPSPVLAQTNVTSQITKVGNPFMGKVLYGRNVWDMQVFENKLYFAHGDAVYNAGATDIISYDPTTSNFTSEFTAQDEQINKLQILENQLTFPGGDSCCGTGDIPGSFYRKESSGWVKYKNIPNALHVFDIYKFNNKLFVGTGSNTSNSQIFISSDNGGSWTKALMDHQNLNFTLDIQYSPYDRFYDFFVFKNELYANGFYFAADASFFYPHIAKFNGTNTFVFQPSIVDTLYPNIASTNKYLTRPTVFQNQVFYSVIQFSMNDQGIPYGLYKTSDMINGTKINLPNNAVPYDIEIGADNNLYVLASYKSGSQFINSVFKSTNGTTFTEVFQFSNTTFARSFALMNNDYYFGLGCTNTSAASNCGDILRYSTQVSTLIPVASPTPVITPKPGDIIFNDRVDLYDYNALLTDFGKKNDAVTKADLDDDNDVDLYDYNILLTNFGK